MASSPLQRKLMHNCSKPLLPRPFRDEYRWTCPSCSSRWLYFPGLHATVGEWTAEARTWDWEDVELTV